MELRMEKEEWMAIMQLIDHTQHPSYPTEIKIEKMELRMNGIETALKELLGLAKEMIQTALKKKK